MPKTRKTRTASLPVFDALMRDTFTSMPEPKAEAHDPLCYHSRASAEGECLDCGRPEIDAHTPPSPKR